MALTVTYSPEHKTTQAVVFGCNDIAHEIFTKRLSVRDLLVYHPLTIPTMFAEIERDRHFNSIDPMITELVKRAVNITKPRISDTSSATSVQNSPIASEQPGKRTSNPEDLMALWLKVSDLKQGMETWKQQLNNMITHSEELTRGGLSLFNRNSDDPTGLTPVTNLFSTDVLEMKGDTTTQFDEIRDLEDSGRRIHQRLLELKCEYDEKIRNCNTIVEGMTLAAQLVRYLLN